MATELKPGVFTAVFARLAARSQATGQAAMTSLGLAVERQAKDNLARFTHPYPTRTTANPGGPPALVSGTLRRSVTHSRAELGDRGWQVKVGTAVGFYPPYPRSGRRTASSRYARYLETGLRDGATYPFLRPALQAVVARGDVGRYVADEWRLLNL